MTERGFIAVHTGAGTHNLKRRHEYSKLSKRACRAAIKILRKGGNALEAAKAAVIVLEDDGLTNAGFGSCLTNEGEVETDAAIMDGKTLLYGGCGAVQQVKNPIELAYDICVKQNDKLPLGLVPPSLLVGEGGLKHARNVGLKIVTKNSQVSVKARKQLKKSKHMLDAAQFEKSIVLDTVGAVCVDNSGHVASACSSGGIILKRPGRVGQAAQYASGVWADSFSSTTESAFAVCTSGCGEHLVRTQLAKEIAMDLKDADCHIMGLSECITDKFLNSRYLRDIEQKLCGALVMHVTPEGCASVLWGHSTQSMSIGYMGTEDIKPKCVLSRLPLDTPVGKKVVVGGYDFRLKR